MGAVDNLFPLASLKSGRKAEVAATLSIIEEKPFDSIVVSLLEDAYVSPKGSIIGITGPPGAGKSTLINALISEFRRDRKTVAVLAVDPSSKTTRGAFLGDRIRMRTDPSDGGVFVRSIAARGRLGGLADTAYPAAILLRALYDKVIVESVGVGQSETDIASVADTVVLCVQPGSGDALQFMKAGIAEIPDIAIVTKTDMGAVAARALADLKGAMRLGAGEEFSFQTACIGLSAMAPSGINELLSALDAHQSWLNGNGRLQLQRERQARQWVESEILTNFGKKGLQIFSNTTSQTTVNSPFRVVQKLLMQLDVIVHPER